MYMENSNYSVYELVSPVECTTFINIYCRQPEKNQKTAYQYSDDYFTQDECLSITDKKYSRICQVDCVILHLNSRPLQKSDFADIEINLSKRFIEKLYCAIKPGAVVVIKGQIQLALTIQGLITFCNIFFDSLKKPIRLTSFNSYVRILKAEGFKNIRSFNVVSGWDDPHSIISTDYIASKYFFSDYIESRRRVYSYPRYFFIKLLITFNLVRYMEKNFLVVAQK